MSALPERALTGGGGDRPVSRLLSVPEVAARLSVSEKTAYRLMWSGALFSVKSGHRRLVPEVAIDAYIEDLSAEARR